MKRRAAAPEATQGQPEKAGATTLSDEQPSLVQCAR